MHMTNKASAAKTRKSVLDPLDQILRQIASGGMVVVVDDEGRENEGDLVCATDKVTPEIINFMATRGRGLICVSLSEDRLADLSIQRMPSNARPGQKFNTAFMEAVDYRKGTSTGISAADRAATARALIDPKSRPSDFSKPGHVFPIQANALGVLGRPGHTEASLDLARLAGRAPSGVICEILKDDGSMARLPDLVRFARRYNLPITSVAAIHAHRLATENLLDFEREVRLPTRAGIFKLRAYRSRIDGSMHLALVMGRPSEKKPALVRVHSECLTGDVFGSQRCDCGEQLHWAMEEIARAGSGVILYMRQEGRGIGLGGKLHAYALQDRGMDTVQANLHLGYAADDRDYTLCSHILRDLGLRDIRLMTNNPRKLEGLEQNGIRVVERVPVKVASNPHNEHYLAVKKAKLGHLL